MQAGFVEFDAVAAEQVFELDLVDLQHQAAQDH
jgi:hypothetical protein